MVLWRVPKAGARLSRHGLPGHEDAADRVVRGCVADGSDEERGQRRLSSAAAGVGVVSDRVGDVPQAAHRDGPHLDGSAVWQCRGR